ncbi:MAG: S8 family serine peptidase [Deinococcota bacterium]
MKKQAGLLLGALLTGCGSPSDLNAPPGTPTYTISGRVLPPGSSGTLSPEVLDALWLAPHVAGQVLVRAGQGEALNPQMLTALAGVQLQDVPETDLQLAFTPAGQDDLSFARRLAAAGLSVQPNFLYRALATPNDPGFPGENRPGVEVGGQFYDQDYLTRINALGGWNRLETLGKTVTGVLTAVLDTGVDGQHPELIGRLKGGYDFCSRLVGDNCQGTDSDPSEVTAGDVGHGTSSAGLIAANTNNGKGIASLTWRGTVLPVKVFGSDGQISGATTASVTAGVNYAVKQGAKVINMSLGFAGSGGQAAAADPALARALRDAASADVVLVAAAGNTPNGGLFYPASDPNVIAVGAVSRDDNTLACYSARPLPGQKALDLVAPGGQAGTGTGNCYVNSPYDILTLTTVSRGSYTLRAGTSEAAPQVSGTAALLRAAFPSLKASQIRQALREGARSTGAGAMLNVLGAVNRAASLASTPAPGTIAYSLNVRAIRGGTAVKTFSSKGTLTDPSSPLPYQLAGLPAGTYTVHADLQLNSRMSSGEVQVTLPAGNDSGNAVKDIQTH